ASPFIRTTPSIAGSREISTAPLLAEERLTSLAALPTSLLTWAVNLEKKPAQAKPPSSLGSAFEAVAGSVDHLAVNTVSYTSNG
ncbi:MAG TPA: hypothetical protein VIZ90_16990, partial [Rhizobiaceae bacterium]